MRNPLDMMKIRSNNSPNILVREISETHNIYGRDIRIDVGTKKPRNHWGWDLIAADKTPIYAVEDGAVVSAWRDTSTKNYGNQIEIEFMVNGKTYIAFYGHLSAISVSRKSDVKEGQIIGLTGHSGNAYNLPVNQRHLHFEIRTQDGTGKHGSIDPAILLGARILRCDI